MGFLAHRRGVGKGSAGARWLSEVGCAGKRLSGLGSSPSRALGEHVLHGIVAVPLEVVRCGEEVVADPIPPRVEGGKMLLRHGFRVARGRVAADLARKAHQHADGQHRRQLVPPPLGMAEVGNPLHRLQQ